MVSDEKSQAPPTRGNQENSGISYDSHSTRGVSGVSQTDGTVNVGVSGTDWSRENPSLGILLGGILEQLLESSRQRLNETRECIEWYEREEKKTLEQVKKLEQLQEIATSWNSIPTDTNGLNTEEE